MPGRDIVVIGGSAGGIEALQGLVESLPPDLPAAVFVVLQLHDTIGQQITAILLGLQTVKEQSFGRAGTPRPGRRNGRVASACWGCGSGRRWSGERSRLRPSLGPEQR